MNFKIGPARIHLLAEERAWDWPHPFVKVFECDDAGKPHLTLCLRRDRPPELRESSWLSEFPTQWRLYRQGTAYRLEILEQIRFRPKHVALIQSSWDRVDFFIRPLPYRLPGIPGGGWCVGEVMEPFIQWWLTYHSAVRCQGMILHGSAVSIDGEGLAFVGPSEAGKTTLARLLRDEGGATVMNDERIVIWKEGRRWWVGGTPWNGELRQVSPVTAPLARLCLLKKALTNDFIIWPPARVLAQALPEAFLPIWNPQALDRLLAAVIELAQRVPSGELRFRNDASVVDFLQGLLPSFPRKRESSVVEVPGPPLTRG